MRKKKLKLRQQHKKVFVGRMTSRRVYATVYLNRSNSYRWDARQLGVTSYNFSEMQNVCCVGFWIYYLHMVSHVLQCNPTLVSVNQSNVFQFFKMIETVE